MTNLTISLDESIVRQARVRAIQQGTSLSAKVREFLASYASGASSPAEQDPTSELMRLMAQVREEARHNAAHTGSALHVAEPSPKRRSLRQQTYQGDFRARARKA